MAPIVEISCASVDDAVAAERGGAARIELCSALSLGGLTPSLGTLIATLRRVRIPVATMLRPRAGGFCFSAAEFETMQRDCELFLHNGANGVVFGILRDNGSVDLERCARLRATAGGTTAVFHRAFDVTLEPLRALDELIELGFTRVLTSGQKPTALEGAELIRQLIDRARGRIEILPGAGVRPKNVAALIAQTGCTQVHLSARTSRRDNSTTGNPQIRFSASGSECDFDHVDESMVRAVVEALAATPSSR